MLLPAFGEPVDAARGAALALLPGGFDHAVGFQLPQRPVERSLVDFGVCEGMLVQVGAKVITAAAAFNLEQIEYQWLNKAVEVSHAAGARVVFGVMGADSARHFRPRAAPHAYGAPYIMILQTPHSIAFAGLPISGGEDSM